MDPPFTLRKALALAFAFEFEFEFEGALALALAADDDDDDSFLRKDWKFVIPCDRMPSMFMLMADTEVLDDANDSVMRAAMATRCPLVVMLLLLLLLLLLVSDRPCDLWDCDCKCPRMVVVILRINFLFCFVFLDRLIDLFDFRMFEVSFYY